MASTSVGGFGGLLGGLHLLLEVAMALQLGAGVALHEREVERPPGQAQEGDPDQLALQEELQEGDAVVAQALQHQDVHPALMIAEHQIPAVFAQVLLAADLPVGPCEQPDQAAVDVDPVFGDGQNGARAQAPPGRYRQQQFEQRDDQQQRHVDHGTKRRDQAGQQQLQESGQEGQHGRVVGGSGGCQALDWSSPQRLK